MLTPEKIKSIESHTGGVNRLRAWVREYGDTVMPIFRDDVLETLKAVNDLIETVRELQAESTALKANLSISQQRRIAIQVNERSNMPPLVLSDKVTDSMRDGQ